MARFRKKLLFAVLVGPLAAAAVPSLAPLSLPDSKGGIGFDDLLFSSTLNRVLVPSGRTGMLNLIDPKTHAIESIGGFSTGRSLLGGHGDGTTSADFGQGLLFASDRDLKVVDIVDPTKKLILLSVKLGGGPDYVRWVETNAEVWVTEPSRKQIEYFKLGIGAAPALVRVGTIDIADGPESLVVDATRGRAYTHTWHDRTAAIDLKTHKEVARWPNGCEGSRGIALDEQRGLLFVGCDEGKATTLDVAHAGRIVATLDTGGKGVDIIAYSPSLSHLYVPGGDSATMAVLGVEASGSLKALGTVPTAPDAHCVAADNLGNAYVCAPKSGQLLILADPFPPTR
jgi:DNA-binding beta-propeller fold protein YncE